MITFSFLAKTPPSATITRETTGIPTFSAQTTPGVTITQETTAVSAQATIQGIIKSFSVPL